MAAEGGVLAEEPPDKHAIGSRQAAFALFKAMVGPGLLFLPAAVKNAGATAAAIYRHHGGHTGAVTCVCRSHQCSGCERYRGNSFHLVHAADARHHSMSQAERCACTWSRGRRGCCDGATGALPD